jgi:hypothetical protein
MAAKKKAKKKKAPSKAKPKAKRIARGRDTIEDFRDRFILPRG